MRIVSFRGLDLVSERISSLFRSVNHVLERLGVRLSGRNTYFFQSNT